jgi:hypothetical protein
MMLEIAACKGEFTMIRASLIGLATAAALTTGASSASAGSNFSIHIGGPGYGFYPGYYGSPAYSPFYDDDCHYVKKKIWVKKNGMWKKKWVTKLVCY